MESMRNVLRRSLARSLDTLPQADRLAAAWLIACGKAMADRGEIVGFEGGWVTVEVEDPVWLDQMRAMRKGIEGELAKIAGVKIAGIHFELKNLRGRAR